MESKTLKEDKDQIGINNEKIADDAKAALAEGSDRAGEEAKPSISVVIPTFNERENVGILCERIDKTL